MQRVRVGTRVEQLLRVNSRRGRGSNVAHVVHAAALRRQAEGLQARQHVDQVARRNLTDLNIRPRGDGSLAVAEFVRDVGQPPELRGGEFARRDPATEHETFLRRRDVEQAMEPHPKRVLFIRKLVRFGVLQDAAPRIQAVLLVLPTLLLGHVGQRYAVNGLLDGWCSIRPSVGADAGRQSALSHACHKPGQVFLLFLGETTGRGLRQFDYLGFNRWHGFPFADALARAARRSACNWVGASAGRIRRA